MGLGGELKVLGGFDAEGKIDNYSLLAHAETPGLQLLSGGLMLGAVFMATDYVTSPMSKKGMLIYGVCIGLDVYKRQILRYLLKAK